MDGFEIKMSNNGETVPCSIEIIVGKDSIDAIFFIFKTVFGKDFSKGEAETINDNTIIKFTAHDLKKLNALKELFKKHGCEIKYT